MMHSSPIRVHFLIWGGKKQCDDNKRWLCFHVLSSSVLLKKDSLWIVGWRHKSGQRFVSNHVTVSQQILEDQIKNVILVLHKVTVLHFTSLCIILPEETPHHPNITMLLQPRLQLNLIHPRNKSVEPTLAVLRSPGTLWCFSERQMHDFYQMQWDENLLWQRGRPLSALSKPAP